MDANFIECTNCNTTQEFTESYMVDGEWQYFCDDCYAEIRRIEALADHLAVQPSCEARQQILDTCETTNTLVNQLRAHDLCNCTACLAVAILAAIEKQPPAKATEPMQGNLFTEVA